MHIGGTAYGGSLVDLGDTSAISGIRLEAATALDLSSKISKECIDEILVADPYDLVKYHRIVAFSHTHATRPKLLPLCHAHGETLGGMSFGLGYDNFKNV